MLDTASIFLRHNLSKKLDVDSYMYVLPRAREGKRAELTRAGTEQRLLAIGAEDDAAAEDGKGAPR